MNTGRIMWIEKYLEGGSCGNRNREPDTENISKGGSVEINGLNI